MKKLQLFALCALLAVLLCAAGAAALFTPYVSDSTGTFTEDDLEIILTACEEFQLTVPYDIFVVMLSESEMAEQEYSDIFYEDEPEDADPEIGFVLNGDRFFIILNEPMQAIMQEEPRLWLQEALTSDYQAAPTAQTICDGVYTAELMLSGALEITPGEEPPQPSSHLDDLTEEPVDIYPWRVFDDADLFTDEEEAVLQHQIASYMEQTGYDMVVHTTKSIGAKGLVAYADDYYESVAGVGSDKHGVLIMQNTADRDFYISTTGDMIDILTDARIDEVVNGAIPYLREDDSFSAFSTSISTILTYAQQGVIEGNPHYYDQDYNAAEDKWGGSSYTGSRRVSPQAIIISILAGLVIASITAAVVIRRYNKPYIKAKADYRAHSDLSLTHKEDRLINSFVTTRIIQDDPPSSGGGFSGGSSTHSSSSGSSHGGGGGKY